MKTLVAVLVFLVFSMGCMNSNSDFSTNKKKQFKQNIDEASTCSAPASVVDFDTVLESYHFFSSAGEITIDKHPVQPTTRYSEYITPTKSLAPLRLSFINIPFIHFTGPASLWSNNVEIARIQKENNYLVDMGPDYGVWMFYVHDSYRAGGPLEVSIDGIYKDGVFLDRFDIEFIHLPQQSTYVAITGPVSQNDSLLVQLFNSEGRGGEMGQLGLNTSKDSFELKSWDYQEQLLLSSEEK